MPDRKTPAPRPPRVRPAVRPARRRTFAVLLATAPVAAGLLAGCSPTPPPFDPRAMGDYERRAGHDLGAAANPPDALRPLPQKLDSRFLVEPYNATTRRVTPEEPPAALVDQPAKVQLALREVIARAVVNNGDVRVAGYTPAIEQTRITEAEAQFDPIAFVNLQYQRVDRQNGGQFGGTSAGPTDPVTGAPIINPATGAPQTGSPIIFSTQQTETYSAQAGIRQNLDSGGQFQASYNSSRNRVGRSSLFNQTQGIDNPFYDNEVTLQLTQPLLRNFGRGINQARIVINRNNAQIALLDFRTQLETTLTTVEQTYWQLVQAHREVQIQEELLQRTVDTADLLAKRRQQDVDLQQLAQTVSQVESRTADLISLRSRERDLSDQLKRLMNDPDFPVQSPTLVVPETDPIVEPVSFDVEDQIVTGLANRPELGQQLLRERSAVEALQVGRNNLLPRLDLVLSGGYQGASGSFEGAASNQVDFDHFNATAGLQLEIPLGNRAARAIYRRAQLQRQQSAEQYRSLVSQVALDVKQALRGVQTQYELIGQLRRARLAAAQALNSLQVRENAGEPLTPQFVNLKLILQSDLATSQRAEAQAVSNYNIAIAQLERSKGTLLKYNNVVMEESALQR